MKKTITINLAGIVFHIEEDAYEVLQQYLSSVKRYFLNVEGGEDIQGDIESRIAEIFSGFITEFKQAISIEEVHSVIKQMGTVEDMIGDEAEFTSTENDQNAQSSENQGQKQEGKRIVRDSSNGLIGGVCAGLAAYFEVNPLWVRLATLALFFGFPFFPALSGTMLISYIVLWIAMPAQINLENLGNFRKYFRSRKDKILGGVAGGIGTYFGIDPVIVRVIFVLFIVAGGSGVILYVLLWAITPEAKSVTDDLQMQGNPVTLNNIEEQIKKNVNLPDKEVESTLVKILVFPFKIISLVFAALVPFFKFLIDALRVFVAVILFVIGAAFLCGIVVVILASLGLMDGFEGNIQLGDFPVGKISSEITPWMIGFGGLAALIPALVILLLSMSLMFRKTFIQSVLALILVGLFFVGAIGFTVSVLPVVKKFSSDGKVMVKKEFVAGYKNLSINMNMLDSKMNKLHPVTLKIKGWERNEIQLNQRFEAQGSSWSEATNNAKLATYGVVQQDSSIIFDSNLSLDPSLPYRIQRLEMTLYLPYNQIFTMDPAIRLILQHTLYPNGYEKGQLDGNSWIFTKSGLKCLSCKSDSSVENEEYDDTESYESSDDSEDW